MNREITAGWSINWQTRWSHPRGNNPQQVVPCSWQTTIGCGVTVPGGGDDGRDWSQRYKANLEKLASGDLVQVVEVVRDLAGREASRGLSAGEQRMLAKARLILLQEG